MSIEKREVLENNQVRLTIRVPSEVWQKALADCYEEAKDMYPLEGEATRSALEAKYGADFLYNEAVNATYPQALIDAVEAAGVLSAGSPALEIGDISSESYSFKATIDLYPDVKLGQYKGLSAVYKPSEVSEEDIAGAIADFLAENKTATHPDRAEKGDEVSIDFEGFTDGKPFEGGKAEEYALVLGGGMFIDGFEDQLVGIAVGEERDVHVTLPTEYTPALAGKDAVFHCKCHAITRYAVPELTEAYARSVGYSSMTALREQLLRDLQEVKNAEAADSFADALIGQVIENMAVSIPDSMIRARLDELVDTMAQQLASQGMMLEQYLESSHLTEETLREHFRPQAELAVRYDIAMTAIAREESLSVSDTELDEQYLALAGVYGMDEAVLRSQLPASRLRHDLQQGKARDFIVANARRLTE